MAGHWLPLKKLFRFVWQNDKVDVSLLNGRQRTKKSCNTCVR